MADTTLEHTAVEPASPAEYELSLVALTPAELPSQQAALAAWCDRKVASLERELAQWVALTDEAVIGGFKHSGYAASAKRTEKRIVYYQKIKAAIEAGYLIVPNMPVNVFAVRVNRTKPKYAKSDYESSLRTQPDQLPAGQGRYVDDVPFTSSETYKKTQYDGKEVERTRYFTESYDEDIDFPLQGVMPEVLKATGRAMALRLFDQLGVVLNNGGRDPIVVGQFLDPRGNNRVSTFFVAWWLNCADL